MSGEAFYLPRGGGQWLATEHTVGPWDAEAQHGGPAAALIGRALERCSPRPEMMLSRLAFEILGAIPVGQVEVHARVVRPGRSVELLEGVLAGDGREVMRCSAWRLLRTSAPSTAASAAPPSRPAVETPAPEGWPLTGYLAAVEWRFAAGGFGRPGPATAWTRLKIPLVPEEEPTALARVLAIADSGNGISGVLDLREWLFINTDLTIHMHREATGEWLCLDAATTVTRGGAGLAMSTIHDEDGPLAQAAQTLLVAPRT